MPIPVKERNAELFIILFSFTTVNANLNPVIFNPLTIKVEPFLYTLLSSKTYSIIRLLDMSFFC